MTQIEFQNIMNSFFKVENNHLIVKDLIISDDIIQLNVSNKDTELTGIQFMRNEKPPVNIIWREDEKILYFTVGDELVNVKLNQPPLKIEDMVDDYFIHDEDILLVKIKNKKIFLPGIYNKILTIKVLFDPVTIIDVVTGLYICTLNKGTYKFVKRDGEWIDIT